MFQFCPILVVVETQRLTPCQQVPFLAEVIMDVDYIDVHGHKASQWYKYTKEKKEREANLFGIAETIIGATKYTNVSQPSQTVTHSCPDRLTFKCCFRSTSTKQYKLPSLFLNTRWFHSALSPPFISVCSGSGADRLAINTWLWSPCASRRDN